MSLMRLEGRIHRFSEGYSPAMGHSRVWLKAKGWVLIASRAEFARTLKEMAK